jgi:predicted DNA-binding transcriptional regulator AlpA
VKYSPPVSDVTKTAVNDNNQLPFGLKPALSTKQAAIYLGLAKASLDTMRCRGNGPPFIRISRKAVRYRIDDLDQWVAERLVANTSVGVAA